MVNIPETRFVGAETEIIAQPIQNLLIKLALGYVDNEIEEYYAGAVVDITGNKVVMSQEISFNGAIRYDIPVSNFGVLSPQFEWIYIDEYFVDKANTTLAADFWKLNGRIDYLNDDLGILVSLFVENIANERAVTWIWYPGGGTLGTDMVVIQRPRTFGVTISYKF